MQLDIDEFKKANKTYRVTKRKAQKRGKKS